MLKIFKKVAVLVLLTIIAILTYVFPARMVYGESMEPTLSDEQWVLTTRLVGEVNRNDFLICIIGGKESVKRVVGLPGELIEVKDTGIFIDGILENPSFKTPENWYEVTLAEEEYFVAGDNRLNSNDSILNGPVKRSEIRGKILYH